MKARLLLAALLLSSCNHPFNPKAPVEQQLVVYSVLSTDRDVQFVRVYTNYDVSGFDPFEHKSDRPVTGARVVITGPHGSYILRDTLLARADTSRYKSPIAAYTGRWRAERGQIYSLTVDVPGIGATSASVLTPGPSQSINWMYGPQLLDDPENYSTAAYIGALIKFSQSTKAISFQLVIEYLVLRAAEWQEESIEVPVWASSDFAHVSYPSVYKLGSFYPGYSKDIYTRTLQRVSKIHPGSRLIFQRIVFRVFGLDQNWYDYYNTVRKFQDPLSLRLDDPDFTNLTKGYGLFAAFAVDSLHHLYPEEFPFNRR